MEQLTETTSAPTSEKPAWLVEILDRFEEAWIRGQRPDLEAFLPHEAPERRAALLPLAKMDLERRLFGGDIITVERYLIRYPELASDQNIILDLIGVEFKQRQRREPINRDDYIRRFPHLTEDLKARLPEPPPRPVVPEPPPLPPVATEPSPAPRSAGMDAPSSSQPPSSDSTRIAALSSDSETRLGSRTSIGQTEPTPAPPPANPALTEHEFMGVLSKSDTATVYKARQVANNRIVAVKMLSSTQPLPPHQLARYRVVADVVSRLQHPNILNVYEVGVLDGRPCFSLELAEGGNLAEKLVGNLLPERDSAKLVAILARAVHAAHQRGLVHRNLKPTNILLTPDGQPKIADFALAERISGGDEPGAIGFKLASLAQSGIGTPNYQAPEQMSGENRDVGPGADIYALGAILYELLTGRPPFKGSTPADTMRQVISQKPVAPSKLNPRTPRALEAICLKCLDKRPEKRYASAELLANDLEGFVQGKQVTPKVSTWKLPARGQVGQWFKNAERMNDAGTTALFSSLMFAVLAMFCFIGFLVSTFKESTGVFQHFGVAVIVGLLMALEFAVGVQTFAKRRWAMWLGLLSPIPILAEIFRFMLMTPTSQEKDIHSFNAILGIPLAFVLGIQVIAYLFALYAYFENREAIRHAQE